MNWPRIRRNKGTVAFFIFWGGYFAAFWFRAFSTNEAGDLVVHHVNMYGDWAAHLTMANTFIYRTLFPTISPFLITAQFNYPFLANWIPALFAKAGLPILPTMVLFSFVGSIAIIAALYYFYRQLFRSAAVAIIGSFIFLLNGGAGFVDYFKDISRSNKFWEAVFIPLNIYTNQPPKHMECANIIDSMVIPQRAFNLGFPLALLCLILLYQMIKIRKEGIRIETDQRKNLFYGGMAALIMGSLPIIHPHSLMALGFILPCWAIGELFTPSQTSAKKTFWNWMMLGLMVSLIALPLMKIFIFTNTVGKSFMKWFPGWYAKDIPMNWFLFWFKNWTVTPFAALAGFILLFKNKIFSDQKLWAFFIFIPFFLMFAALNLFILQPWIWDNTKMLAWASVGLSGLAGYLVVWLWTYKAHQGIYLRRMLSALLMALMVFTGALDVIRLQSHQRNSWTWYNEEELRLADWTKIHTPIDSVWLTADQHNHWLYNLTGRQAVMAYNGWLWTYGLQFDQVRADVTTLYHDPSRRDLFEKYHITNATVGPTEIVDWKANKKSFDENLTPIFSTERTTLYHVPPKKH